MHRLCGLLLILVSLVVGAATASAHPHVWVKSASELIFASDGTVTGVRHAWTFDETFSADALQGVETKTKGVYTREDLAALAQTNVDSLKEFGYFSFAKADGKKQKFVEPTDYYLEYKDAALVLHFVLPFKAPFKARQMQLEVFDPSYFVDFQLQDKDPIKLVNAPVGCALAIERPSGGAQAAKKLGEDNFLDGGNADFGAMFANKVTVTCP